MNGRQRLYAQLCELTATSMDLRSFPTDEELKGIVYDLRELKDRMWRYFWSWPGKIEKDAVAQRESQHDWDEHALRVHAGLEDPMRWHPPEMIKDDDIKDTLRRYLTYEREVRWGK